MMFNVDLNDAPDSVISPTTFLRLTYVCLFLSLRKKTAKGVNRKIVIPGQYLLEIFAPQGDYSLQKSSLR